MPRTSRPTNASHPHSRLNLPHPIPSHTYNGLKTFSLSTPIQAVLLHRLSLPSPSPSHTYNGLKTFSFSTTLQAVFLHRLSLPSPSPSHTYNGLKTFSLSTPLQAVLLHRLSLPSSSPSHTYNGLKSFSLSTPLQAVLLHRLNLSFPTPSHTDTSQQNSHPPQPSTPKKSPRGVQRGRGFAAPLRFTFSSKKYCASFAKKANATQYFKKSISNLLLPYLTTRTLYIPSISLSSSSALAEAALSRSIRV